MFQAADDHPGKNPEQLEYLGDSQLPYLIDMLGEGHSDMMQLNPVSVVSLQSLLDHDRLSVEWGRRLPDEQYFGRFAQCCPSLFTPMVPAAPSN